MRALRQLFLAWEIIFRGGCSDGVSVYSAGPIVPQRQIRAQKRSSLYWNSRIAAVLNPGV